MGNAKNKKQKINTESFDFANSILCYIYVLIMLTFYLLILHNKYFDITKTRYTTFVITTIIYVFSALLILLLKLMVKYLNDDFGKKDKLLNDPKLYEKPSLYMVIFVVANIIACFMGAKYETILPSGAKTMHAFYGDNGRYMGLATFLLIGMAFLLVAKEYKGFDSIYVIFGLVVLFALCLALSQHTKKDTFGLKEGIKKDQYNKFISTFGNINIFASFLVIAFAVALAIYIYTAAYRKEYKLFMNIEYSIVLFVLGMATMTSNSDSAYIGMGAIVLVAFILTYRHDEVKELLEGLLLFCIGNLAICFWHTKLKKYPKTSGLARKMDNIKYAIALIALLLIAYIIVMLVRAYKKKHPYANVHKNLGTAVILLGLAISLIVVMVIGVKSGNQMFKMDYRWGTFRGYIWDKCIDTYKEAPLVNKILGHGNETVKQVVSMPNKDEMIQVTKKIYDNAHNEILQYMITLGAFGALAYILLIGSSIIYTNKYGRRDYHTFAPLYVTVGYFAQGLINIDQPITTPLLFMFMSMGVGYATFCKKMKNKGMS